MSLVVVAIFIPAMTCGAQRYSRPITDLDRFVGNWYDNKGNLVMRIDNNYSINDCKVVAFYLDNDYTPIFFGQAVYTCRINEGTGYRDIHLDSNSLPLLPIYSSKPYAPNYHEMIVLDGKKTLRKTKNPRYFESIGGIYIGMDKDEVIRRYGQPSSVGNNYGWVTTWKYKEGFDVNFAGDTVISITMYKNSDRRLDWSGLSANNTRDDFKYKYGGTQGITPSNWIIGYGESIHFDSTGSVTLSTISF